MDQIIEKLSSRKLWATVLGCLVITLGPTFGLSEDAAVKLAAMVSAYVVGQGIADAGARRVNIEAQTRADAAKLPDADLADALAGELK
tara:strand:- start:48 stop:311 length:264 start_codon:yes stop_codon:yes gene_type:complete